MPNALNDTKARIHAFQRKLDRAEADYQQAGEQLSGTEKQLKSMGFRGPNFEELVAAACAALAQREAVLAELIAKLDQDVETAHAAARD